MSLFKSKKKRVLIVDDHALMVDMLCEFLERSGYETIAANSASQALHQMHLYPSDVVLMDIQLPDQNGLDLLEKFRKRHSSTPVIMFTGMKLDDTLMKSAMGRGASACLSKGEHLQQILRVVNDTTLNVG